MADLTFRTAAEADLDRVLEIHTSAFPDARGYTERRTNFTANARGDLDALWLALDGEEIVAHAFLFPMRGWFGGTAVGVGAIASVGVAPEARGRGIAARLLAHLHDQANAQKACVTLLYAFRQGFYAKHGYAPTTPNRRLRIHPSSIPEAWRSEQGVTVRAARAGDRGAIVNAYTRAATRGHGWLARPQELWDRYFANERRVWIVATEGRRVAGYVAWSLSQAVPHGETRLAVREVVADDDAVRRALLGAVGAQRDQVAEVEIEVDASDPLDRALVDADRARFGDEVVEHSLGTVVGGPMVRLVDVARALAHRGYATDGAIDLAIEGRPPLHFAVTDGKAKLTFPRHAKAPLAIGRAALAAVAYGGLRPSEAARIGWAQGDDATLARADALFGSPPFFALDAY